MTVRVPSVFDERTSEPQGDSMAVSTPSGTSTATVTAPSARFHSTRAAPLQVFHVQAKLSVACER